MLGVEVALTAVALAMGAPADSQVNCLNKADYRKKALTHFMFVPAAFAYVGGDSFFQLKRCKRLVRVSLQYQDDFDKRPAYRPKQTARDQWTFAHEVSHMRGEYREQVASCEGVRQVKLVSRLLGVPKWDRLYLAKIAGKLTKNFMADAYRCVR